MIRYLTSDLSIEAGDRSELEQPTEIVVFVMLLCIVHGEQIIKKSVYES
jgi:hypothetical protein